MGFRSPGPLPATSRPVGAEILLLGQTTDEARDRVERAKANGPSLALDASARRLLELQEQGISPLRLSKANPAVEPGLEARQP